MIGKKNCFYFLDIADIALQEIPEDDVLQDLSDEVSNCAMHIVVELGLSMTAIERILNKYPKGTSKQAFGAMKEWKSSSKVKTTILMLMKAMESADGGGLSFFLLRNICNSDKSNTNIYTAFCSLYKQNLLFSNLHV
jgi:hypothetical protein